MEAGEKTEEETDIEKRNNGKMFMASIQEAKRKKGLRPDDKINLSEVDFSSVMK